MALNGIPKFTIYDYPSFANPARVRIAIIEKKLEPFVSFEFVDLLKGDHKKSEFRNNLNFAATVPVLKSKEDDGLILIECAAITLYLDTIVGEPTLTGRTPEEKAKILMVTKLAENVFLDPITLYFHNATEGLGKEIEGYQNKEWGMYQLEKGLRGLRYFDQILQTKKYVAGDHFTMADATVIALMLNLEDCRVPIPEECVHLLSWYARMQQRPSVKNRMAI